MSDELNICWLSPHTKCSWGKKKKLYLVPNHLLNFVRQSPKWLYSSPWGVQEYLHRIWRQSIQLSSRYFPQNHKCRHHDGALLKSQEVNKVCWVHLLGRMNPSSNCEIFQSGSEWWTEGPTFRSIHTIRIARNIKILLLDFQILFFKLLKIEFHGRRDRFYLTDSPDASTSC